MINFVVRRACLPVNSHFLERMTVRQRSICPIKILRNWKTKWNNFVERTDFWKGDNADGLWGHYGRHYNWHGNENFILHIEMCGFLLLLTFYAVHGLKKVEVMADRSWKGRNREFLWHAIEDRLDHEYAFAWEPFEKLEPPKLLLMRTLQKEMWASALKHGTWFLDPEFD